HTAAFAAGLLAVASCALPRAAPTPSPAAEPDAGAADAGLLSPPDAGAPEDAGSITLELPPAPDDPMNGAYRQRLDFRAGAPAVPVRLMEGASKVTFSTRGRLRMKLAGSVEKLVDGAPGTLWTVRIVEGHPAQLMPRIQLAEFRLEDRAGLQAEQKQWETRS